MKDYCENETEFEARVETTSTPTDPRVLYQCVRCKRVARTKRKHQKPGPTTASHDNTMQGLWAYALEGEPMNDNASRIPDEVFYSEVEARFEEKLKQLTLDREWSTVAQLCGWYETFLELHPQALEAT